MNYAAIPGMEVEFEDDYDGLYANLVALNRYLGTEWGYNYEQRLFIPPFISFADPDARVMLLEEIMKLEVPKVIQTSTGPSMHTSPFRPENDRFWSICSEAGIKLCTHLATVTRYGVQGLDWNEEEVMLGDMDAFQWAFYYGDRPAMETVGAAILQGWFARFPKMQLLLSEQGTVWVPYTVRKLDHAFLMGRRGTWGTLDRRPSDYFKDHCFVAPFPEENVDRAWRWWARSPSRSGRTSHTGRASRSPRCTSGSSETSTTRTPGRSCATTWRGSSISRSRAAPIMRIGVFFPTKEYATARRDRGAHCRRRGAGVLVAVAAPELGIRRTHRARARGPRSRAMSSWARRSSPPTRAIRSRSRPRRSP